MYGAFRIEELYTFHIIVLRILLRTILYSLVDILLEECGISLAVLRILSGHIQIEIQRT